jgi:hypothetical protein
MSRTFEGILDYLFIHRIGFEIPNTMPGFDNRGYNVHTPEWETEVIKDCEEVKIR